MKNSRNYISLFLVLMVSFSFSLGSGCSDDGGGGDFPWYFLLSSEKEITAFSITAIEPNTTLSVKFPGSINGTDINVIVPAGTDVTAIVATFTTSGTSVAVGGAAQASGTTVNNFTNPVTYTVTAENGTAQDYTVSVNANGKVHVGDYFVNNAVNLTKLSGYIGVTGILYITDTSIINLDGLDDLIFIGRYLDVGDSVILMNLTSINLSNLTTAGGLYIIGNGVLTSINLSNLTAVVGRLGISGNVVLTSINLSNLNSVGDDLYIDGNIVLTSIDLSNLTTVWGSLQIDGGINDALTSIDFSSLTTVEGDLGINNNDHLTTISFSNLTTVGGDLWVLNNDVLTSIDFSNLPAVGDDLLNDDLWINNNDALTSMSFDILCSVAGNFTITNNTLLCNDIATDLETQLDDCNGGGIGGLRTISGNNVTCP